MNSYFKNVLIELPDNPIDLVCVHIELVTTSFDFRLLNNAFQEWDRLGQYGAFCELNALPEESKTAVDSTGIQKDSSYVWHVQVNNCDTRCLIVLANVLIGSGYKWNPEDEIVESVYSRIKMSSTSGNHALERHDLNITGFEFNERHYPQLAKVLRPLVIFEGTSSIKTFRRMILEFNTYTAETKFDQISEIVGLWTKVVRNGYPRSLEDLYTGNSDIQDISIDVFDENSIEIKVETFGGTESAWNCLINIFGRIRSEINIIKVY